MRVKLKIEECNGRSSLTADEERGSMKERRIYRDERYTREEEKESRAR